MDVFGRQKNMARHQFMGPSTAAAADLPVRVKEKVLAIAEAWAEDPER